MPTVQSAFSGCRSGVEQSRVARRHDELVAEFQELADSAHRKQEHDERNGDEDDSFGLRAGKRNSPARSMRNRATRQLISLRRPAPKAFRNRMLSLVPCLLFDPPS